MDSKEILKLISNWLEHAESDFATALENLPEQYGTNPTEKDVLNIDDPEHHASYTLGEKRVLELLKKEIEARQ
jgi:hypothetical protein